MTTAGPSFLPFLASRVTASFPPAEGLIDGLLKDFGTRLDPRAREQLGSLRVESDPGAFHQGLLNWAREMLARGNPEPAVAVFSLLGRESSSGDIQTKARRELDAISGKASLTSCLDSKWRRFVDSIADWRHFAPMFGTAVLGRWVGAALWGNLIARPAALGTRGLGARLAAEAGGLMAEVPAFLVLQRTAPSQGHTLGDDFQSIAISLLTLRLTSSLGQGLMRKFPCSQAGRAAQFFVPLAAMFAGIWAASKLQGRGGSRPHSNSATGEILEAMLGFVVGNELGRRFLGPGFGRWERELRLRDGYNSNPTSASRLKLNLEQPATAGGNPGRMVPPALQPWFLSTAEGPGGGNKLSQRPEIPQPPKSPEVLARALAVNERVLLGDRQVLRGEEVFYLVEDESMGGNTPSGIIAINMFVDPGSGQIRAVGNHPNIPESIFSIYPEITFWVQVLREDRRLIHLPFTPTVKRLFTYGDLHQDVVAELGKLVGREYQAPTRNHYPKKYRR